MRFKTFLEQESENPFKGYEKNLASIIKSGNIFYRGTNFRSSNSFTVDFNGNSISYSVMHVKGRKEPRNSQTRNNVLMGFASEWDKFPNRSYSTFASQDYDSAAMFGNEYSGGACIVIPADSITKFGWMLGDFNQRTTEDGGHNIEKANEIINGITILITSIARLNHAVEYDDMDKDIENGKEFADIIMNTAKEHDVLSIVQESFARVRAPVSKSKDIVKFCDSLLEKRKHLKALLKSSKEETMFSETLDELFELLDSISSFGYSSVMEALTDLVTPEKYKATAFTSIKEIPLSKKPTEIWFEGDYILLQFKNMDRIKQADIPKILQQIKV